MYFGDHPPPHFHITSPSGSVKMTIVARRVMVGRLPQRLLREALRRASANEERLMRIWSELSEPEDSG